ncbi:MAG: proprotein convertase P-domain-containing protein [Rubripirellula sp.]
MLTPSLRLMFALFATTFVVGATCSHVNAQAGLRATLDQMDKNENGEIDPDEITPLARPFLERIAEARRLSLHRSNDIEKWQEAARIYHALQNGVADKRIRPTGESSVKTFEPDHDQVLVPEFGLPEVKYPYTQDDLDFADRTLRSHDDNRDGVIDRIEAQDERWTHRQPYEDDLNKDDRLSRLELAQRYARRRLLDGMSDQLRKKAERTGGEIRRADNGNERRDDSQWWRRGGSSHWLTATLMGRFDLNKNGRLEATEALATGMPTSQIDANRDGELTRDELHAHVARLQDDAGDPSSGIPGWFYELDANRDRQVSMSEFTEEWSDEKLAEFASIDANQDGLLTSAEVTRSKTMMGGNFSKRDPEVLPPGRTVISEIEVSEDFLIGDLNLQISITHSNDSHLDAFLTGPDGQRIELFTSVGGNDDNFDETIFDDQSKYPITKARPPFKGTFLPEGLLKRQPSLSHFNGKSIQGVWQLAVHCTRSDRFGMLHGWSLFAKPIDDMLSPAQPTVDGPQPTVAGAAAPMSRSQPPEQVVRYEPQQSRPKIDYEGISRRMQEAVKAGKMTEEQVKQTWIKIKENAKRGGDDERRDLRGKSEKKLEKKSLNREEAMERYRRMMEQKRGK